MTATSVARLATGPRRLLGPAMVIVLGLFPFTLFAPVLTTKAFILSNELALARVAYDLFFYDAFLFFVVAFFGIMFPFCKMILSVWCWYRVPPDAAIKWIDRLAVLGKLSMHDVILLALFVIAYTGIGVGVVQTRYGLYFYGAVILASHLFNLLMSSTIRDLGSSEPTQSRIKSQEG